MHEQVIAHPHVVDIARQAMVDCDIEPQMKPIRGGTDGRSSHLWTAMPKPVYRWLQLSRQT